MIYKRTSTVKHSPGLNVQILVITPILTAVNTPEAYTGVIRIPHTPVYYCNILQYINYNKNDINICLFTIKLGPTEVINLYP